MPSNFRIQSYQTKESIHLTLLGDFDNTSAYELIEFLGKTQTDQKRIFIHMNGLRYVNPLANVTLQARMHLSKIEIDQLAFTGGYTAQIAPYGNCLAFDHLHINKLKEINI